MGNDPKIRLLHLDLWLVNDYIVIDFEDREVIEGSINSCKATEHKYFSSAVVLVEQGSKACPGFELIWWCPLDGSPFHVKQWKQPHVI